MQLPDSVQAELITLRTGYCAVYSCAARISISDDHHASLGPYLWRALVRPRGTKDLGETRAEQATNSSAASVVEKRTRQTVEHAPSTVAPALQGPTPHSVHGEPSPLVELGPEPLSQHDVADFAGTA